jgi:3-oxoacyl-[acyl-carrier-protein] synthase III
MRNNKVTIIGTGSYLPNRIVLNEELCSNIDSTPEWVEKKLGILERRMVVSESTSDLAYYAALKALESANVDKEDLDLIMVVTSSPDQISPSTACVLHNKLNIKRNTPSFDINAVCAGFVYAMSFASTLISSGIYKKILIVASETYSKHTDMNNRHCVFFGDGAGAVVLGASEEGWMVSEISSNGNGSGMTGFRMPLSSPFEMIGKEVWDQAVKVLPESIKTVLTEANVSPSEIKMLVPHQPSINILKIVAEEVGMPMNKVKTVMDKYGNIAGASIPIALDDAIKSNEIVYGDKILLSAVGAGWAWGSMLIQLNK